MRTTGPWKVVPTQNGPAVTDQNNRDLLTKPEALANARLMAAAPALYAACEEAMAMHDGDNCACLPMDDPPTMCRAGQRLRAALASARGEAKQ